MGTSEKEFLMGQKIHCTRKKNFSEETKKKKTAPGIPGTVLRRAVFILPQSGQLAAGVLQIPCQYSQRLHEVGGGGPS